MQPRATDASLSVSAREEGNGSVYQARNVCIEAGPSKTCPLVLYSTRKTIPQNASCCLGASAR